VSEDRVLTDEQAATFQRDGFVVVRRMFGDEDRARIAAWCDEMESRPETPGADMKYFEESLRPPGERILQRLENFYPYHDGFGALFDGKLRQASSELFESDAVLFKDKINFKKPGGDGFKPHQDQQAGWGTYADLFITAMVSIDKATVENGCLELVAGHHDRGLIGGEWMPLDDENLADMDFVPCPTEPGDAVFFDSYCPHGSKPNLTNTTRRILYITYNRLSDGDHRTRYYADKRKSFPPDIERVPGKDYVYRV
jgi:ectoine hydroxylase-related dioxygenase (phytanoyl-CoA dioxygenase family)